MLEHDLTAYTLPGQKPPQGVWKQAHDRFFDEPTVALILHAQKDDAHTEPGEGQGEYQ